MLTCTPQQDIAGEMEDRLISFEEEEEAEE